MVDVVDLESRRNSRRNQTESEQETESEREMLARFDRIALIIKWSAEMHRQGHARAFTEHFGDGK